MAYRRVLHLLTASRGISSTPHLASLGWINKIKNTFTGKKAADSPFPPSESFNLNMFADSMEMARKVGTFKNFVSGRCSEATVVAACEKHAAVLRYLATIDPTGEKLKNSDKISATKHCNCTIADVEHILAKYTWAKDAQKKIEKLKEEGKPVPKTFTEVQNLMGNTALDVGRANLTKSGQISRNALCPCGSKKRYKKAPLLGSLKFGARKFGPFGVVGLLEVKTHAFLCLLALTGAEFCSAVIKKSMSGF